MYHNMKVMQLIEASKQRPSMYWGGASVTHAVSFLNGWVSALESLDIVEEEYSNFCDWLRSELRDNSTQSIDKLLQFKTNSESQALELFYSMFEKYKVYLRNT